MESEYPPEELATKDDVLEAVNRLTRQELILPINVARFYIRGTEFAVPEELLNEAIARAARAEDGGRRWPKYRVPFVPFLIMTMRSIADSSRRSVYIKNFLRLEVYDPDAEGLHHDFCTPSAEEEVIQDETRQTLARQIERIEQHFKGDPDVIGLIRDMREGKSATKEWTAAGLSRNRYEAAYKRLRRGLKKLLTEGNANE